MNFIVDAHVPPGICALLRAAGHDAIHTRELPDGNRTLDKVINEISVQEKRVVVSKDIDFYHSHLLERKPYKLLLIRTGNIGVRSLKELFERNLPQIVKALDQNSLVELDRAKVSVIA